MAESISYGLGLDQGVASIGWALLKLDAKGKPIGIERMGTHIFEAGTEGDIASGRDESRAGPRRMARQLRKQYRRRTLRKRRLLRWLQELGLMPAGDVSSPQGRDALLKSLDAELRAKWEAEADHRTRQLLPYRLRAAGLRGKLEPFELGRALYHLAQRRGYLSNRKQKAQEGSAEAAEGKKPDEGGEVRAAIIELERQMRGAGCKTLAEYFATLDPAGTLGKRLRGRWTAREMFEAEFEAILDEQVKHYPHLALPREPRKQRQIVHPTPRMQERIRAGTLRPRRESKDVVRTAREELHGAIFFQRPLQSMRHLLGYCTLIPEQRRCPVGHRLAQRFRALQQVNNLLVLLPDNTKRSLTRDERDRVLAALERDGDIPFTKLRGKAWLNLPKGTTFNLEEGGEKKLIGNRTAAKCRAIFGEERWDTMGDLKKDELIHDLIEYDDPDALRKRGRLKWGLDEHAAAKLAETVLEPGYASHCKEALEILIARMEEGTPYATAVKEEFKKGDVVGEVHDLLPPFEKAMGELRNPAVTRALTELRKLVNAIVRRYGKPTWIRLELARELKRARKQRERMSREMRAQEERRDLARAKVIAAAGGNASRADIERVLLAEECGWVCPYTGKQFGIEHIVGRHPQVDVEHIWPLSRSLDDSYLNKTLCFVDENRNVKKNRTPYEAYARTAERWDEILDRVKRFRSDAARIKLERFMAKEIPDDFAERHLAETRKIGAESAAYLGLLYGGEIDASRTRRVFVTAGGLTAHLRREWHLNALFGENGEKSRDDHRHHAVDALVVALTDTRAVQLLQRAAEDASAAGRRLFAPLDEPWPDFLDSVRPHYDAINVSYRQSRRVSGKLHAESNYSRPTGRTGERRIRKELAKLSEKEVDKIVDDKVRAAVKAKLTELKGPPNKVFALAENHPHTVSKKGQKIPIHKVRIVVNEKPWSVAGGARERFVSSTAGSNHHTVIAKDDKGKWTDTPVPLIEARGEATPKKRPHGGDEFTLAAGDFAQMKDRAGTERLFRVLSVSEGDIELIPHNDARISTERKKDRTRGGANSLLSRGLRKVTVTYLGEIRRAGG